MTRNQQDEAPATGLIARLHEQAKTCTLKKGDRVGIAGTGLEGTITQDGGYGYFKINAPGHPVRLIRHFTDLFALEG